MFVTRGSEAPDILLSSQTPCCQSCWQLSTPWVAGMGKGPLLQHFTDRRGSKDAKLIS